MIESYQQELEMQKEQPKAHSFATVTAVYEDGLGLQFDGENEATEKHFKCNRFGVFHAGDRVRVIKDGGTYIAEYPVGEPNPSLAADTADSAENASYASNAGRLNGKSESQLSVDSAETCTTAAQVDNTGTSYADIQFRCSTTGTLQWRLAGGSWYTLSNK